MYKTNPFTLYTYSDLTQIILIGIVNTMINKKNGTANRNIIL